MHHRRLSSLTLVACLTLIAAALSACGGGTTSPGATPVIAPAAAPAARVQALAAAGGLQPAYDPDLLLDWAERTYPSWFPGPEADRSSPPYLYRYYDSTQNAVGVAGNNVAVLGPISGGQLLPVGSLSDYECSVLPNRCSGPTLDQRRSAAAATAQLHADCVAIQPFHWSVGDAGGRVGEGTSGTGGPQVDTVMAIASASKWLYGSYVAEQRAGQLSADDVTLLNFTSGYTGFDLCLQGQTVAECQAYQGLLIHNGGFVPANVGRFFYSGGHMQKHAVLIGLGSDDNAALSRHVGDALGITIAYSQPQLAGGVATSAEQYGRFLQRLAAGKLRMAALLGTHAVCTNPDTCPTAIASPIAGSLSWHYAIGHWVEDDPASGDGSFSSAGAFGFYPWLDKSRTWWGIVARRDGSGVGAEDPNQKAGRASAICGAHIRAAWMSGRSI